MNVQIADQLENNLCTLKSSLREPPRRIAWHSVGGMLHLRAEIMIEREGTGSRLRVQLYALRNSTRCQKTHNSPYRALNGPLKA